jgi:glyoxylase-like metal-dependent hydrolase (beta-lactamase superfamily II)
LPVDALPHRDVDSVRHDRRKRNLDLSAAERGPSCSATAETWVYPGHGKDTTLGDERPHLEEWRARGW